jgi:hypothetical protein
MAASERAQVFSYKQNASLLRVNNICEGDEIDCGRET